MVSPIQSAPSSVTGSSKLKPLRLVGATRFVWAMLLIHLCSSVYDLERTSVYGRVSYVSFVPSHIRIRSKHQHSPSYWHDWYVPSSGLGLMCPNHSISIHTTFAHCIIRLFAV